jgi:NADP-reducing hydrogenase subunit HndB
MGTSAIAAGAREVMTTVLDELDKRGIENVEVAVNGGSGLTDAEPVICVEDKSGEKVTYANVNPAAARKIVAEHLVGGKIVDGLAVGKIKEPPLSGSRAG